MEKLFTPVTVGRNTLPNRAVMAPMTRSRAEPDGTPGPHAAEYYAHHRQPLAPSPVAPDDQMFTATGLQPIPEPRALDIEEIGRTVDDFRHAARRAIEAGADGVEQRVSLKSYQALSMTG